MIKRALIALGLFSSPAAAEVPTLSVVEAATAREELGYLLIDVRTPQEWNATGVAKGAKGLTLQDREFLQKLHAKTGGDTSRPIAFICRTGSRSETATRMARKAGYTNVFNVRGGMVGRGGWVSVGLPIESFTD